jgi:hypothetical protein
MCSPTPSNDVSQFATEARFQRLFVIFANCWASAPTFTGADFHRRPADTTEMAIRWSLPVWPANCIYTNDDNQHADNN